MRPVRFSPFVLDDLADAASWYDRQQSGVGDRFLAEFRKTAGKIAGIGLVLRRSYGEFRHLKTHGFPYLVYYREDAEGFFVALVVNAARDPALIRQLLAERR